MYAETILFKHDMPITFDAYKMGFYHLHCHVDVIEVLMVISGSALVKVSFEQFTMKEGDYIVINNGDSHSIYATDSKCQTVSLYFNMASYREQIPYLDYIIFACESFDLVKYKNETQYLRQMISTILSNIVKYNETSSDERYKEAIVKAADELLWIFVNDYDMKNYYNRNWDASYSKAEKYYRVMKYIVENYNMNNIIDYISKAEFYSKSYITRLFKEVGGSSFQDILTYVRLYKSEMLLLDSDLTIAEIADMCGFSDIKYYNSNFKKWFLCTPFEYRRANQPEILKTNIRQRISNDDVIEKIDYFIRGSEDNTVYKAAITPLNIKGRDALKQIFEERDKEKNTGSIHQDRISNSTVINSAAFHQICIAIDENSDIKELLHRFPSFQKEGYLPAFLINYRDITANQCREIFAQCMNVLGAGDSPVSQLEIVIAYSSLADTVSINRLLESGNWPSKLIIKPMLIV